MLNLNGKTMQLIAWSTAFAVSTLAFVAWGSSNLWNFSHLSTYQIFPLLGLLAFSLMWTHYIIGTLKEILTSASSSLRSYYQWTGYAVLILICLHPGLLIYQLFRDGAGLPPGSYERYVAPGLGWVTLLGTVSLLIFLAFELHRVYGDRKWWHYVEDLSDLAMLAIIYHSFRLGSQLQLGWYKYVWWFYAVTFIFILARKYYFRLGFGTQKARP
jgi:predicted ferric reductase